MQMTTILCYKNCTAFGASEFSQLADTHRARVEQAFSSCR